MTQKDDKLKEILRELAAEFFSRESNRQSLITITGIDLRGRGSKAVIMITVMPEEKSQAAMEFVHRNLTDFKKYVQDNSRIGHIPYFDVEIDVGEKNRQKIDEIENSL